MVSRKYYFVCRWVKSPRDPRAVGESLTQGRLNMKFGRSTRSTYEEPMELGRGRLG